MKKTPIRRISKDQQERLRVYYALRKDYLKDHPTCEMCQNRRSQHIHHKKKPRKTYLNDVDTWEALCFQCHDYVESNKSWARENGWLENI